MMKKILLPVIILISFAGCRKSSYTLDQPATVTELGGGPGNILWTSDKEYLLSGFVFVNDGQTLTIEAGTVIRAETGQGSQASALIIARGGRIIAEGTSADPIIFTVENDDLQGSIPAEARGLWGGLVILGNAPVNKQSGEDLIEGIPVSEPRGIYGGPDPDDNSGILRYVSIRHGGTNIGEGNEINGLTLGGVGRQTIVEYVEVIANEDDGVEIFGGTVNCRNMVVSYCGDDAFDIDQGYRGKCQFLLGICNAGSDKGIEISGGLQPLQVYPGALPVFQNITLIGDNDNADLPLIDFKNYGAGHIRNSIFLETGKGIAISHAQNLGDSYNMFLNGAITLENNLYGNPGGSSLDIYCYNETNDPFPEENAQLTDSLRVWKNSEGAPVILTLGIDGLLSSSLDFDDLAGFDNSWFEAVDYKGAFGAVNWTAGWTLLDQHGF